MPVVMEMNLLLIFFGGCWASPLSIGSLEIFPNISEVPNLNSVSSSFTTKVLENTDSTRHQSTPIPYAAATEHSSAKASVAVSDGLPVSQPKISQEVATEKSSMLQESSTTASGLTPPAMGVHTMMGGTMTTSSLETSNGTNGLPVTMATSSLETSNGTNGLPVTMATSSLETSNGTNGLPVTMATSSQEPSKGTSGLPSTMATSDLETSSGTSGLHVTMATSYLETSSGTSGLHVTMATSSLKISSGTSGLPVTMATSSLETPRWISGSPISGVKIPTMTTPKASTNTGSGPSSNSNQKTNKSLLMAVLIALLVVIVLLALLLLWRQRQKRRTGALTLSRGVKRNGVVDAWAGPAQVSDEEAGITMAGVAGGDKDPGVPDKEDSGHQAPLTTFFGKQKSCQGSLALEELKSGSAPSLKVEEEPLVGSENGAVEASDGLEAANGQSP